MIPIAFSSRYIYPLPEGHRFPIEKYELVKEQLVYEGTIQPEQLYDPGLVDELLILAVHDREYWQHLKELTLPAKQVRKIGLPVTELSVQRARNSVAGTVASAQHALKKGVGINLSGGTHHAYRGHGEGFCVLNDLAIASQELMNNHSISQILIVDLDVHQGNGTAKIFENDPRVFTFSMHGESNYPLNKERSDLDIALPKGTGDDLYLKQLKDTLQYLLTTVKPDFIFYQSGVDVLAGDRLGKLALSKEAVKERDSIVLNSCKKYDIPVVITMGGGYHQKLPVLVDAHCNTSRTAMQIYS